MICRESYNLLIGCEMGITVYCLGHCFFSELTHMNRKPIIPVQHKGLGVTLTVQM